MIVIASCQAVSPGVMPRKQGAAQGSPVIKLRSFSKVSSRRLGGGAHEARNSKTNPINTIERNLINSSAYQHLSRFHDRSMRLSPFGTSPKLVDGRFYSGTPKPVG